MCNNRECYPRPSRSSGHHLQPHSPSSPSSQQCGQASAFPRQSVGGAGSACVGVGGAPATGGAARHQQGVISRSYSEGNCLVRDELLESEELQETEQDTSQDILLDNIFSADKNKTGET